MHYGGSNDLELGDKVGVDSGTLRADVSEGDDQDDDEEGEHVRRNVSLYEMASIFRPYFWPHSTTNKLIAISTYTVMALSKIAGVMAPAYIGYAGNKVQECYQDPKCGVEGTPYSDILLYTGLTFLASALGQLQSVVYLPVKQNAYIEISESTYRHLMSLSYDWFIKKKQGDVLRCMDRGITSADQVVSYLFLYLFPTIVQCFVVFGIFYTKFVSPELCACAFLSLAIYGIVTVQMTVWRKKFRQKKNKHDDRFHTLANDALTNYETVKYFANEEYEIKRYSEAVREFQTFDVSVRGSLSLLNSSQQLIIQACMCFSLLIASGGILGNGGELKIGDFLAINVYITQLYQPLNFLGTIYGMIIQAIVDLEKLSMLLGERPDVVDGPGAGPMPPPPTNSGMGIEFRNVYFNYPRQNPEQGIKGASFVVPPGTVTALVGPTGCGKTTLGRLLFRFYDPRRGSILVNGKDIRTVKQRSLRSFIGVVPQDTVLFNDTLRHNVNYGRLGAEQHELEEAVAAARLTKFIASLAEGWETVVGERGLRLSGGEKQRVSISRALLKVRYREGRRTGVSFCSRRPLGRFAYFPRFSSYHHLHRPIGPSGRPTR